MKFSILIANYNYSAYLRECLDSALGQTRPPDEIIVVDDGSTDDSLAILNKYYGQNPLVRIISQHNQGHNLSVAIGVENARGDIFCLLDADDRYKPEYLAELEQHYERNPKVDLTFCRFEAFGSGPFCENDLLVWLAPQTDYDYGYTALLTYFGGKNFIGNVTSTLSLRRRLAQILNLRNLAESGRMAEGIDFIILYWASLLGARKFYLHKALIEYRHHEQSDTFRRYADSAHQFRRRLFDLTQENYYRRRSCISDSMRWELPDEAATIPKPLRRHLRHYRKVFLVTWIPRFLRLSRTRLKKTARMLFGAF
jgi:glycosyltransferase involved in cell wall biosynthesis